MAQSSKRKRADVCYVETSDSDEGDSVKDPYQRDDDADVDLPPGDGWYGAKKKSRGPKRRKIVTAKPTSSKKTENPKADEPFPFLSLPPELRGYIYELALTEPAGVTLIHRLKGYRRTVRRGKITLEDVDDYGRPKHCLYTGFGGHVETASISQERSFVPNLLATNRQIHDEAIGYLYKQPLVLDSVKALHVFLANVGHANRLVISHIVLKSWGRGRGVDKGMNFTALDMLSDCINLRTFRIDCQIDSLGYWKPKTLARHLFSNGYVFFRSLGDANGKKDAGLDILQLHPINFHLDDFIVRLYRPLPQKITAEEFEKQYIFELRKLLVGKVV